jgi:hypothetical protein
VVVVVFRIEMRGAKEGSTQRGHSRCKLSF